MQLIRGDYGLRWVAITGLALIVAIGLIGLGINLDLDSLAEEFKSFGTSLLVLPFFIGFGWVLPRYAHLSAIPIDFVQSSMQLSFAVKVSFPLTYIAAAMSSAFPLVDNRLKHFDLIFFAFDDYSFTDWVNTRPDLTFVFGIFTLAFPCRPWLCLS